MNFDLYLLLTRSQSRSWNFDIPAPCGSGSTTLLDRVIVLWHTRLWQILRTWDLWQHQCSLTTWESVYFKYSTLVRYVRSVYLDLCDIFSVPWYLCQSRRILTSVTVGASRNLWQILCSFTSVTEPVYLRSVDTCVRVGVSRPSGVSFFVWFGSLDFFLHGSGLQFRTFSDRTLPLS
jgi:hypothetical protein